MYKFVQMTAADVMTAPCKFVSPELTVVELHRLFEIDGIEAYPVVSGSTVVGIASKFDALRAFAFMPGRAVTAYDDIIRTPVRDIMSRDWTCARPDTLLVHVIQSMIQHRTESLPVLDADDMLLGVVGRDDIFKALQECAERAGAPHGPDGATCRLTD